MTQQNIILLVEDETFIALALNRILERAGYRVLPAQRGEKAIELACAQVTPVDLILVE